MRSPSSFRLNLMVPWEAGCDGPICSSMISSAGSDASIFFAHRAGKAILVFVLPEILPDALTRGRPRRRHRIDFFDDRLAAVHRIVLAQRMADEGIVEQDAPQVGMIPEVDAEHVEAFALQPV